MTDDLKERLLEWSPWGGSRKLREEAVARITDLEARLAAAKAEVQRLTTENEIRWRMEKKWQDRAEAAEADWNKAEDARVSAVLAAYEARRKG